MIVVLGDLIADLVIHIDEFPINSEDLKQVYYSDLGPGGATNVAIAAARLGLSVGCFGEVGNDRYGEIIVEGLSQEEIDVAGVVKTPGASTPLACVIVDVAGEPAYLGYRGTLAVRSLQESWRSHIRTAEALFVEGWADHEGVQNIILDGLKVAKDVGVPRFFDPGPGNPAFDMGWHLDAASLSTVLLLNEIEAERLSGNADPHRVGISLLEMGPELVVVKRGSLGCRLWSEKERLELPGFSVELVDTTGAGDSFNAAVIYGYLGGLGPEKTGVLANATGAAKVQKHGTGLNVPTREEVWRILEQGGYDPREYLPNP